uniref:DNA-directed RNA polymerase subunit n=1 Tax=Phlebotomus papatasi TaxID=29031 RepID=A0A1B0DCX1_PHLPP
MIYFNRGGDSGTFHLDANELKFSAFTSDEVKKLSKVKIFTAQTIDRLGLALPGGLYDRRMGPYDRDSDPCQTCGRAFVQCEGHLGHIELNMLVYNPIFIQTVYSVLRISCLSCFKLQLSEHVRSLLELQLRLVDAGYIIEAQELEFLKSEVAAASEGARVKLENGESVHPKVAEFLELLERSPINHYHNKNTEELRLSIISTTLKMGMRKTCLHCKHSLKRVKYSYKTLMIGVTKQELTSFYNKKRKFLHKLGCFKLRASSFVFSQKQSNEISSEEIQNRMRLSNKAILADECREYCRKIYENYPKFFLLLFPVLRHASPSVVAPFDIFFTNCIAVTPPKVRPAAKMDGRIIEHPQTEIYKNILTSNVALKAILEFNPENETSNDKDIEFLYQTSKGGTKHEKIYNAWREMQTHVDETLDITMNQNKRAVGQGLKQILEKKEGIIRMHMMGKRVNYAARTVITPDPNVDVEEIGIPELFAKKLTYPVPVTPWNIHDMRKFVMNGPDVYPGANFVEDDHGKTLIPPNDPVRREAMAKLLTTPNAHHSLQVVHRHLMNNDILLLNRQPTLHRPSIMAHKARILKGEKTFRLHYSNCKSYNADFDGDEMNAHCPQNEMGRSEAYNLVHVPHQYLVPKDGTPLGGLIQDHIISGVKLSMRGRFFTKEDYYQLIFQGVSRQRGDLIFLPPAIMKPRILWSGKQVLSTVILNIIPRGKKLICLTSTSKINSRAWESSKPRKWKAGGTPLEDNVMSEAEVIIRQGELLVGILDKMHYGSTAYSLIHCIYELYGPTYSTRLLSAFARLFTYFLQWEGFTLGPKDILVLPDADKQRTQIIEDSRKIGNATAATALNLPEDIPFDELKEKMTDAFHSDPKFRTIMDRQFKSALDQFTNNINRCCIPTGLITKFPQNNLQLMVQSGAKGSAVNAMQISCLLGQIELEGKRPPLMVSGKSLPSFPFFETSPKAGGFIDGRFLTGIQPQDFFFHCMAGREGLIDTAVKTSRSGYLQRCLIKHLEGLNVNYDSTVRDSDNSVVQFLYGEDGLDITKSQFFKTKMLSFLDDNAKIIGDKNVLAEVKNDEETADRLHKYVKSIKSWEKKNKNALAKRRVSSFLNFCGQMKESTNVKNPNKMVKGRRRIDEKLCKMWEKMTEDERKDYRNKAFERCPDPIVSKFLPGSCFGSITENMQKLIREYGRENPTRRKEFTEVMNLKAMQAVAPPGEPVGLLAAQSIGEPSTQMTLNTFHFAGRGEMNVTLGIPRLREILMLASKNIKTPSMDIPFKQHAKLDTMSEKLRIKLGKVTVGDVLESINVKTRLVLRPQRVWEYKLLFRFLPRDAYKEDYCVKPKQILKYMSQVFFKLMFRGIMKLAKEKNSVIDFDEEKTKKNNEEINEDEEKKLLEGKEEELQEDEETASVIESNEFTEAYKYDKEHHLWCELIFHLPAKFKSLDLTAMLREVARKAVIWQVPCITRAITYFQGDQLMLKTQGINIVEMFQYNKLLDLDRLYSNDIHAIAQTYGIEAAGRVIVKEVQNVFKVYGITVDPRHLFLISDYMTFNGTISALSRKGMESSASPLQQMSFESCMKFLKAATVSGCTDNLSSPSSRLMVGQPCKSGTGAFTLLNDNRMFLSNFTRKAAKQVSH